jgi:3-phosphoshikimate 1-carboxyvinyltransferase
MRFQPAARIAGALVPPPDKSISHRAALLAAMSRAPVRISNYLRSHDTASTIAAITRLGAQVEEHEPREAAVDLKIGGVGLRGAQASNEPIDVGNAGTLLRLLPGWLAGQGSGAWTIDGDESIRRRPVDRIAEPLSAMGGKVRCREGRLPPLEVEGSDLHGIYYELPVASAQVKSCILLAGLLAVGGTKLVERAPTRDHTEVLLRQAGVPVGSEKKGDTVEVTVGPVEELELEGVSVPGDFSSAAFFVVAATLVRTSDLTVRNVGLNPTRTGLLDVMARMGASVEVVRSGGDGEPRGELKVRHANLTATSVEGSEVPLLIDELPLVALLGAFAEGATVVSGAGELRRKESDRIATVTAALRSLGANIDATEDGFVVEGGGGLRGGEMDAAGDHRLAMLGAVAGVASREGVHVRGFDSASVSYPTFVADLEGVLGSVGAR